MHNCLSLILSNSCFFIFPILVITNRRSFHYSIIVIVLRCVSRTALKTVSKLGTIYTAGIHSSYIYLHSSL